MDKATIIGSGLAGPLLSILLAQKGYEVHLYEKRVDPRINDISAGRSINLALSHRGIMALKQANVFDLVQPNLIPMKGRMIHSQNGELDFQPYSINPDEHIYSVSRAELNKILMTAAENSESGRVNIHFHEALIAVDDAKLTFSTGKTIPNEGIIIGADGAGSKIRKYIDSHSITPSHSKPLGHAYKELNIAPSDNGEFQLDANSLHIWPREEFMLIALPNKDKTFTCTLFLPTKGDISIESLKTEEEVNELFQTNFNDAIPLLENFPQSYFHNTTGSLATVYADEWRYKNHCLVGDAAHAVVPFFGQGMNASFEDCIILMDFLGKNNGDWDSTLTDYAKHRKPDADAIAQMAIENYIEMRNSVTQPQFIHRMETANILYKNFPTRFIPRYNMVSFTSIPYSQVYQRGEIQKNIISTLNGENIDLTLAESLITKKLSEI